MIKIKFISDFHGSTPEFQNKKQGEEIITTSIKAKALVHLGVAEIIEEGVEATETELNEEKAADHAALIIVALSGTPNWEEAKRLMDEYLTPQTPEPAKTTEPEEPKEPEMEEKTDTPQTPEPAEKPTEKEEKQRPPRDKREKEKFKTK